MKQSQEYNQIQSIYYYNAPSELLCTVEKAIKRTDVVLDIGCGIRPMNYFRPKLHLLIEPCKEYVDILSYRNAGDKSVITINQGALEALERFADNSVDSIFLLDVIEHIEKDVGLKVIQECERVAREQIIVFTPLGFMPQHVEHGGIDAWGLTGGSYQEHLSGWLPEDFSALWTVYICKEYHHIAANGSTLENPFGTFFAIRNFDKKNIAIPEKLSDICIPFFSAYDAEKLNQQNQALVSQSNNLKEENQQFLTQIQQLIAEKHYLEAQNQQLFAEKNNFEVQNQHLFAEKQNLEALNIQYQEQLNNSEENAHQWQLCSEHNEKIS